MREPHPRTPVAPDFDHDRLREVLRGRGWTAADLCRAIPQVSRAMIAGVVYNGIPPSARVRAAIEHILGPLGRKEA